MSEASTTNNIIEFFKELDTVNGYDVYIPSLDKDVKFKQLATGQLKSLLKTAVGEPIYNTEFIITFNNIIKENCLDKSTNTDLFTIYDKLFILFKTKIECISPDYTFYFTDEEINDYSLSEDTSIISLLNHYNNFKDKKIKIANKTIQIDNITIECALPTLDIENKFENELHKDSTSGDLTTKELQDIVGDTFINEISKFIMSISINDNKHDLNTITFSDRVKIVEKMPVSVVNDVIKYIEEYKKITKELAVYIFNTDKEVYFEKEIPLDATLFNI
jgi:hypothetical protein